MSGDLGSLVISLTAETAQFKDSLTKAAYQMDQNMGQMVGSMKGLQSSLGAIDAQLNAFGINLRTVFGLAAAGGLAHLVSSAIEAADRIHDLSERTGIASGELAAMREAAATGGITLEEVAKASTKFSKAIETQNEESGAAATALAAMGLSMEGLKDHSPAEQMHMVAERMNEFADGSGKAAAAQILFGKSGAEVLPFLKNYGEQVELTKAGYEEFANNADRFGDSLARLKIASQDAAAAYAKGLLPSLIAVAEGFEAMNATKDQTISVMVLVGEAVRVLALGVVVLWTAIKDLIADLVTGAKVAFLGFKGDIAGVYTALEENTKKIAANDAAMLAFFDKIQNGSLIMGEHAAKTATVGDQAAAAKPKIEGLSGAVDESSKVMDKAVEAATNFHDKLIEQIATLGMDEAALLRYKAVQLGLGTSEDANIKKLTDGKNAIAAHTKAVADAEAALKKLVDAETAFHDGLVKTIETLGMTADEIKKYDARAQGLFDSQDDLIDQAGQMTRDYAAFTAGVITANQAWRDNVDAIQKARDVNAAIIVAWEDGNRKLADQVTQIGLTKTSVEMLAAANQYEADMLKVNLMDDLAERAHYEQWLYDAYQTRLALINSGAERQAMLDQIDAETKDLQAAAAATEKIYADTARSINKSLVDALYDGLVRKGQSFGEMLKSFLESTFKNLILRPILQPASDYLASIYQQGAGALSGLFGAGGALGSSLAGGGDLTGTIAGGATSNWGSAAGGAAGGSWAGAIGGAAIGGAITSQYGSKSPYPGMIAGGIAGYAAVAGASALAAGASAATAFAAAAAAVPVIGWIVAAIALIASFAIKPGGGPKVGSFQSADYVDGMLAGRSGYQSSGGGDNAGMNKVIDQFNESYIGYIKALGGKAISAYSVHSLYETDPQGTASSYGMFIVAKPGQGVPGNAPGQANVGTMAAYYNSGKFDPTAENFQLYASRALLAAIQASELPADIAHLIDGLAPNSLNSAQISNVLAYASAFHSLPDKIKAALDGITGLEINPETSINLAKFGAAYAAVEAIINADVGGDVQTMVDQANMTAIEKFRAQGAALSDMAAQFDGSADAALNLAQATATYYQNQIQLLAALEQATATFHKSIADLERSIQFDMLGGDKGAQQAFYQREIASDMARLADAAGNPALADPSQIAAWAEQARADYSAWFNTLDESQKAAQGSEFIANLDKLDAQLTAANKAVGDQIKAQNDPSNPNSPIAQVKSAFDKFMLDMGKWLEDNKAVATDQTTAAQQMQTAADTMVAAADTSLAAAQTPTHVDLTWNGSEVTAGA